MLSPFGIYIGLKISISAIDYKALWDQYVPIVPGSTLVGTEEDEKGMRRDKNDMKKRKRMKSNASTFVDFENGSIAS